MVHASWHGHVDIRCSHLGLIDWATVGTPSNRPTGVHLKLPRPYEALSLAFTALQPRLPTRPRPMVVVGLVWTNYLA